MRILSYLFATCFFCPYLNAQFKNPVKPTPAQERIEAWEKRNLLRESSPVRNLKAKNIGPTVFSGRVSDIDANPGNPAEFYVAYASGGLWYTKNNGTSFKPVFDHEAVMTIGDIAVDWENGTIWVGTGEVNSSRSSYAGVGMYMSRDTGTTWNYKGLPESHHIGRIILHPNDSATLWVAVLGHLYSPNKQRGVYKTIDEGKTWDRVLFVDEHTGAVDLVIDPNNSENLYAATWQRTRRAWDFIESGPGSGIHKTADGGNTWQLISGDGSGFPHGEGTGRIGIEMTKSGTIYGVVDNYFRRPKDTLETDPVVSKDILRTMTNGAFLELDSANLAEFLEEEGFPDKYTTDTVFNLVRNGTISPKALVEYLEDANTLLFETPVIGAEVYLLDVGGETWHKTHEGFIDRLFNSYGYYFGQIRVSPHDDRQLYILGVPILRSDDGGATWTSVNQENVHVDHHALWIDPNFKGHLILGNDGGINISYDFGETWIKCNSPSVGQFYTVEVDNAKPYRVYGGLQDNGVWMGSHRYRGGTRWHSSGHYPYKSIMGGDGMQIEVDTRNNSTVYTGFQFGNYFRINTASDARQKITPMHELGERPYRWNWQSPIHLSRHNQDILYMGSNIFHRSMDQGEHFINLSDDLTDGGRQGDVPYGTLTTISESPLNFGLIYTGSDDGLVHVTRDGAYSWQRISDDLPRHLWVSRVLASEHAESRVYITLNGSRWDHFDAYLFVSEDYGKTWARIGKSLPNEPVNVITEHPSHPEILFIGTDHNLYVSFDKGTTFTILSDDLPDVAVHDVAIQKREQDLITGTHGRSFYTIDIGFLPQIKNSTEDTLFVHQEYREIERAYTKDWGERDATWMEYREPEISIPYYVSSKDSLDIVISNGNEEVLIRRLNPELGLNYLEYDLAVDNHTDLSGLLKEDSGDITVKPASNGKYYLHPGEYSLLLRRDALEAVVKLVIK